MLPINDNPPPGVVDRRDGSTKGECGITTTKCLFCSDQIAASKTYVKKYKNMRWGANTKCRMATCPYWNTDVCWLAANGKSDLDKNSCPVFCHWRETGQWLNP